MLTDWIMSQLLARKVSSLILMKLSGKKAPVNNSVMNHLDKPTAVISKIIPLKPILNCRLVYLKPSPLLLWGYKYFNNVFTSLERQFWIYIVHKLVEICGVGFSNLQARPGKLYLDKSTLLSHCLPQYLVFGIFINDTFLGIVSLRL